MAGYRFSVLLAVVIFSVVFLLSCSESTPEETVGSEADSPASVENAGEEPDGRSLLEVRCTRCHSTDRIFGHKKAQREHWAEIVDEMIGKGARLDENEKQLLIDFLVGLHK